ncbi:hypothetical protein IFM58399_00795 [Aspergillus lentulus]|uniref:AB hydrolase-1 domain-containing protein n=1 Tax=Aspergillus lentulus TaxID=293939 RepID=A0AAN5YMS8_ASPLE|nr:uncharacterized protein IFM58399_00795 [Aspergillus lentulus]KAF4160954.1 hypothetical protein CNMCM6069_006862 [Aspergillus lentulus]KAF4169352.1 hypothetical protein CNMCM6936_008712 [Aspergillus lentulus]KAF4180961.1 hypothetical protein CNMCM8060_000436 [Aspergillus lentulus]KAF4189352.1 hypothetical protein CNMCM7927_008640 [Aspergillus lentulus]KAF4197517.1 hypothetical protein CNMCM8694_002783 [Aspergillus lentulus]
MHLSAPTYSFNIPSVHDGTELECRLYLPLELQQSDCARKWHIRGAIIAHPYAPLGGCYDDPVVGFIGGELLRGGSVVGTFNFRGAGESGSRTSWTAKPELADYVSFYGFMLHYLHSLKEDHARQKNRSPGPNSAPPAESTGNSKSASGDVHLILGGYSYGSMVASHLPTVDVVARLFSEDDSATAFHKIRQAAKELSALSIKSVPGTDMPSTSSNLAFRECSTTVEDVARTTISYLLVSPLLPPVNLLLTSFSKLSSGLAVKTPTQSKEVLCPKPADQLCSHRTLAIYGNHDTFTSAHKLRKWASDLSEAAHSQFQSAEIDGAGHFWREKGVESRAREALRTWLGHIP